MDAWHVALISVAIPALITAGLPYLSGWAKRRQAARLSDVEFGLKIRDELRADNRALRSRVEVLEGEAVELRTRLSTAQLRITRLEEALRRRGHHDVLEDLA